MATSPTFIFQGLAPYIERSAQARGADTVHMVKASGLWHVTQVQNALGQLSRLQQHQKLELMAHAEKIRECLAAVLGGIDDAIAEVKLHNGLVPAADAKPIKLAPSRQKPADPAG